MTRLSKAAVVVVVVVFSRSLAQTPMPVPTAARQTTDKVTIAVEPYRSKEKVKQAFGKTDFAKLGILPILVVIQNDSDRVLRLENMRVEWITADRQRIEPIPAEDVERSGSVKPPKLGGPAPPIPGVGLGGRGRKPAWEITAREFVAPVAPAGSTVQGFFYFRVGKGPDRMAGSKIYITGIQDARTGQDLLYFEIGLDTYVKK